MTTRELKGAIRRHMTTARQHANAARLLANTIPDPDKKVPREIWYALLDMEHACKECRLWWKNA